MSDNPSLTDFSSSLPAQWTAIYADEATEQVSVNGKKIKERDYAKHGRYPIVDQGQSLVGGYTDDPSKIIESSVPLLVFGDHTKVVKYLETPFAPGAEGVKVLAPKEFLHPRALYYFLQYLATKIPDKGYARHFQHLVKECVPVPPEGEQVRIVEKLEELFSTLDKSVEYLRTAQDQLKVYRQSLLKHAFEGKLTEKWREENASSGTALELLKELKTRQARAGRRKSREPDSFSSEDIDGFPLIPSTWAWVKVAQIGDVQLGRQRAPQHHNGDHMRPYLRVANVFENRIDTDDVMSMNFTPEEYDRYVLSDGDILLNEGQSLELVGRSAIYRGEVPGACFQNTLVRLRVTPPVMPEYAQAVFVYYLHSGRFQKIAKWTTSIAHLGAERFAELEFPLPPIAEQEVIVEALATAQQRIIRMQEELDGCLLQATALRQSILKQAFAGKLVPQDPTDEPATVLLERIKAAQTNGSNHTNGNGSRTRTAKKTPKAIKQKAKKA